MIKAINFDLDGVYFLKGKENFIENVVAMGVEEKEVRRVFIESSEMHNKYKVGQWSDEEFWNWAVKEWNLSKSVDDVINLLIDCYQVNPEVVELVRKVRSNGYRTMICTNNFPARVQGLQKRFGFLDDFDVAVLSYEVGSIKPNIEIFKKLVEKSGVAPEEVFLTDDDQIVLKMAQDIGMQTYLYESFEGLKEALAKFQVKLD